MSTPPQPISVRSLWYKWKSLRLPWRKQRLVGQDLSGVTFWELHNANLPGRPRRIAKYPRQTHHSDAFLSPAWIQWLRHTRPSAPSIEEQQLDVLRQQQLKHLAAAADARWAEKPSFLDSPKETRQLPAEVLQPRGTSAAQSVAENEQATQGTRDDTLPGVADKVKADSPGEPLPRSQPPENKNEDKSNPWAKHRGGPSEEWQPQAWSPGKIERG